MIDISTHIVVDNNIGNPKTLGEAFDVLNKEKYLNDDETKSYRNMVGLRNILSHEYVNIDKKIIYNILKNNLIVIKKFIVFIHDNFIWRYDVYKWLNQIFRNRGGNVPYKDKYKNFRRAMHVFSHIML